LTVEAPRKGAAAELGAAEITEPPGVRGTLLYTRYDDHADTLVIRRIGTPGLTAEETVASYRMTGIGFWIGDPLFSPDGTMVAVKCADSAEQYFSIHVLSLADGTLAHVDGPISQVANIEPVSWSPDGKTLAYWHGDYVAHERYWPPVLYIHDRETGKATKVLAQSGLRNSVSWAPNSHLLYTLADLRPDQGAGAKPGVYSVTPSQPAKHTYVWAGDVRNAAVSPDARWMAAFVRVPSTPRDSGKFRLLLRELRTSKNTVLDASPADNGELHWSTDSGRLYSITATDERASVYQYTVADSTRKLCCTFDFPGTDTRNAFAGLRFIGVSQDEKHLIFFQRKEMPKDEHTPPGREPHEQFLKAVNLATGEVSTICHLGDGAFSFMDWHDESGKTPPK
jgi:Tol biopolymer transport system component